MGHGRRIGSGSSAINEGALAYQLEHDLEAIDPH
jgi:hypothetical protein